MSNRRGHLAIEDASAWILRIGLAASLAVMLIGVCFSFAHGTISVQRMQSDQFDYHPAIIWRGILHARGKSIIEAGVYLLVLTPILRVVTSIILFASTERDWTYAVITTVVLFLVLAGLIFC